MGKSMLEKPSDPHQLVPVKLHLQKHRGNGVYVNVNNRNYFIPRGEVVEVPYYVAAVLENSAKQDEETARMIEGLGENAKY